MPTRIPVCIADKPFPSLNQARVHYRNILHRYQPGQTINEQDRQEVEQLMTSSGIASRFSCLYKPGATKAQIWYKIQGKERPNAAITVTLIGTKNGETTPVAIMRAPSGNVLTSGKASRL